MVNNKNDLVARRCKRAFTNRLRCVSGGVLLCAIELLWIETRNRAVQISLTARRLIIARRSLPHRVSRSRTLNRTRRDYYCYYSVYANSIHNTQIIINTHSLQFKLSTFTRILHTHTPTNTLRSRAQYGRRRNQRPIVWTTAAGFLAQRPVRPQCHVGSRRGRTAHLRRGLGQPDDVVVVFVGKQ